MSNAFSKVDIYRLLFIEGSSLSVFPCVSLSVSQVFSKRNFIFQETKRKNGKPAYNKREYIHILNIYETEKTVEMHRLSIYFSSFHKNTLKYL